MAVQLVGQIVSMIQRHSPHTRAQSAHRAQLAMPRARSGPVSKNDLSCPACQSSTITTISLGEYLRIDYFQCSECSYDFMAERPRSGKLVRKLEIALATSDLES